VDKTGKSFERPDGRLLASVSDQFVKRIKMRSRLTPGRDTAVLLTHLA
jgi:hypothetical protein